MFGVGSENTVDAIAKSIDDGINTKFRNYNCHNQFMEILLGHGIIALVIFLFLLMKLFRSKSVYARSFIFMCVILFLVESYLQRQAGVIFFTFWYSFFLKFNKDE